MPPKKAAKAKKKAWPKKKFKRVKKPKKPKVAKKAKKASKKAKKMKATPKNICQMMGLTKNGSVDRRRKICRDLGLTKHKKK